jgi:hypothetical protein
LGSTLWCPCVDQSAACSVAFATAGRLRDLIGARRLRPITVLSESPPALHHSPARESEIGEFEREGPGHRRRRYPQRYSHRSCLGQDRAATRSIGVFGDRPRLQKATAVAGEIRRNRLHRNRRHWFLRGGTRAVLDSCWYSHRRGWLTEPTAPKATRKVGSYRCRICSTYGARRRIAGNSKISGRPDRGNALGPRRATIRNQSAYAGC